MQLKPTPWSSQLARLALQVCSLHTNPLMTTESLLNEALPPLSFLCTGCQPTFAFLSSRMESKGGWQLCNVLNLVCKPCPTYQCKITPGGGAAFQSLNITHLYKPNVSPPCLKPFKSSCHLQDEIQHGSNPSPNVIRSFLLILSITKISISSIYLSNIRLDFYRDLTF